MRESWVRRLARARQLVDSDPVARPLLEFYTRVLDVQKSFSELLASRVAPSLPIAEPAFTAIAEFAPPLLRVIGEIGPEPLRNEAARLLASDPMTVDQLVREYWHAPSDRQFFAKALLQPYASSIAESGTPIDRGLGRADNRCAICGGAPQLSILDRSSSADGGGRALLCALCLSTWPFRRVRCAKCGEEDERRLGYFHSPQFEHLRIDACETCKHYLKTVDLTRLGIAVPLVDEVAGASLDLWARDHGYIKVELNLLGY